MASAEAMVAPLSRLFDEVIADPRVRDKAKLELLKLESGREMPAVAAKVRAILAEAGAVDPWAARARPSFLYVMYALILWSVPMGLVAAVSPEIAAAIAGGMTAYLRGIPEELYALFGTGYLGYTAARAWGKAKGVER